MSNYCTRVKYQAHDGVDYYCKFDSIESFVKGYEAFMGRPVYQGVWNHLDSGEEYLNFITSKGYCPDKAYTKNILKIAKDL
jgi:flagellum-specific peptidoglycan hydrolase FlgJ